METMKAKSAGKKVVSKKPDHEMISERAYQIYLDRVHRGLPGNASEDWLKAEKELRKQKNKQ